MTDATQRLVYARDMDELVGSRHQLARDALAGTRHRVARGAYIDAEVWNGLRQRERYLELVHAVAETRRTPPVFSFWSAAVLHGLPVVGEWPTKAHVSVGAANGGRTSGHIVRHVAPLDDSDVVEVAGLHATSIARTVLDLAGTPNVLTAVAMADRALHRDRFDRQPPKATREDLERAYEQRLPFRARARARLVLDLAVDGADSVLESVSRFNMRVVGAPRPVLQQRFDDHLGLIGWSEFYWPEHRLVGEADGRMKYLDPEYRGGRTLERVLYDEKVRADRLRSLGLRVTRWDWETGLNPHALRRHLAAEALPMGQRW
jgi:hypothetical protein